MRYSKAWMGMFDHKELLGKSLALAVCLSWFKMFSLHHEMKKFEKGICLFQANNTHKSRTLFFVFPIKTCIRGIFLASN